MNHSFGRAPNTYPQMVHPWKLTWHWKVPMFNRKYIDSNGRCSIVMFVFGGVYRILNGCHYNRIYTKQKYPNKNWILNPGTAQCMFPFVRISNFILLHRKTTAPGIQNLIWDVNAVSQRKPWGFGLWIWQMETVCPLFWALNPPKEGSNSMRNEGHFASRYIESYNVQCILYKQ